MANSLRGQVDFDAGGKLYKLSFSTNALVELEEKLDMSVNEIAKLMGEPERFRMKTLKVVFWAGLQDYQPGLTLEAVGEILRHQLPNETTELVSKAFALTWPSEEGGAARPPEEKAAGNGQAFSQVGNS